MSLRESDREDLLREATALVERAEFRIPAEPEPVIIGFRRDGAASVFFGAEAVYHFNAAGELRRAYIRGLLYKAERGRLISLRRQRSDTEVTLLRTELKNDEAETLLTEARHRLIGLQRAVVSESLTLVGQVPSDGDVISRISAWLSKLPGQIEVAAVPNAR